MLGLIFLAAEAIELNWGEGFPPKWTNTEAKPMPTLYGVRRHESVQWLQTSKFKLRQSMKLYEFLIKQLHNL